jgi:hypothetical protein
LIQLLEQLKKRLTATSAAPNETSLLLLGKICSALHQSKTEIRNLAEVEFKVFSQFGDDGIIQYLVNHLDMPETFIEFGVENYSESNTRYLLLNNNWRGMVLDGDKGHIEYIRKDPLYWRHDLTAVEAFVTKDNINGLFTEHGFTGEIGILSIDIDGNDYWIWDTIHTVNPVIVIVEYNSVFGGSHSVSIPYAEDFYRTRAHYSNLYWGCSLSALEYLAQKKGYVLAGCNSAGNNAYFIRKDRSAGMPAPSVSEAYVVSKFRESRDSEGNLTFLAGGDRLKAISECEVIDVKTNSKIKIKDL